MVNVRSLSILELKKLMAIKFNRIDEILKERGVKQKWLAEQLGISNSTMNQICTNHHQPNVERLFKIAEILNVHPCDLLGDGQEIESKE